MQTIQGILISVDEPVSLRSYYGPFGGFHDYDLQFTPEDLAAFKQSNPPYGPQPMSGFEVTGELDTSREYYIQHFKVKSWKFVT